MSSQGDGIGSPRGTARHRPTFARGADGPDHPGQIVAVQVGTNRWEGTGPVRKVAPQRRRHSCGSRQKTGCRCIGFQTGRDSMFSRVPSPAACSRGAEIAAGIDRDTGQPAGRTVLGDSGIKAIPGRSPAPVGSSGNAAPLPHWRRPAREVVPDPRRQEVAHAVVVAENLGVLVVWQRAPGLRGPDSGHDRPTPATQ